MRIGIFLLAIVISLGHQNRSVIQNTQPGPQVTFEFNSYNFGDVRQGEIKSVDFRLKNTGNKPVIISNVLTSCGCTASEWPRTAVLPDSTALLRITFDSNGKIGHQKKIITVLSNALNSREQLTIEAYVLPRRSDF